MPLVGLRQGVSVFAYACIALYEVSAKAAARRSEGGPKGVLFMQVSIEGLKFGSAFGKWGVPSPFGCQPAAVRVCRAPRRRDRGCSSFRPNAQRKSGRLLEPRLVPNNL